MFETLYVDGTVTQYSLDCFLNKTGIFEYVDTDFFILQKLAHADDASDFNYWRKMRRLSECSGQLLAYLRWVSLPEKERKEQSDKDQQLQRSCKAAALQAQRYLLIEQLKLGSITHAEARHLSEQFQQQLSGKRVPQNNRATTTAEQLSLRAFQSRLYQDKSHQKNSTIQKSHRGGVDSCESYVHSLSTITGNTIPTTAIRKDSSDTRDSHSRSGSLNDSHVVNLLSEYDSEHANQVHSRRSISYEHERFNQLTVVREALARSSKVMHDNLNYL